MRNFIATYTISRMAEPVSASVLIFSRHISIGYRDEQDKPQTLHWKIQDVEAGYEMASGESLIRRQLTGEELRIIGKDAAAEIKEMQAEMAKPWYRKKTGPFRIKLITAAAILVGLIIALYFQFVPWLAEKAAGQVSVETERQLGDEVYGAMQLGTLEDTAASRLLNDFFASMEVNTTYRIRIAVIKDNVVNAFAVPGGRIVVYSALLDKITTYPELAALLSHEFTHVNNRHATRSIFRNLGYKIFLALLFGDMGSVSSILISHTDDLKSLSYSRSLEEEADREGLSLLMQRKIYPEGFTSLFHHLSASAPGSAVPELLASHPDIEKRAAYIKELSKQAERAEHPGLQAIFEQLKKLP